MTDELPGLARYIDAVTDPVEIHEVVDRPRGGRARPRRAVVVALVVAMASAGVGVVVHLESSPNAREATGSTLHVGPTSAGNEAPFENVVPVGETGTIGQAAGWAMNGLGLYRSDDNGDHWFDITTPDTQDPVARITALSFLDADHAWAAVARNHLPLTIYRSVDGGHHWFGTVPTGCVINDLRPATCGSPTSFTFIDAQHGWMFAETGSTYGLVFATVDGGSTWKLVGSAPFDGKIVFADHQHGWGVSGVGDFDPATGQARNAGGALYRTEDGGHTWQPANLHVSSRYALLSAVFSLPRFFGRDGVMVAWLRTSAGADPSVAVYTTSNAGQTWTPHAAPSSSAAAAQYGLATSPPLPFDAINASTWVLFFGPRIAITRDAGRHWTSANPSPPIRYVYEVSFTSATNGWALVQANTAALVRTTNGGKTWQLLAPAGPATPPITAHGTAANAASVTAAQGQPAFLSTTEGWICATPLRYTTNGGATWQPINVGRTNILLGVDCAFAPGGHAWIVTYGPGNATPSIVRVVAGPHPAVTASPLPSAAPKDWVQSLAFADLLHGWAVSSRSNATPNPPSTLYRTVDGGAHWQPIVTNAPVSSGLRFTSPTTGWGIGGVGARRLEHTDDGGRTWRSVPIVPTPVLDTNLIGGLVSVFPFGNRIVVDGFLPTGNFGKLFIEVSNDDGAHWSLQTVSTDIVQPPGTAFWQFLAVDATHWRVGDFGLLVGTDDAGTSWPMRSTHLPLNMTGISFVTPNIGWASECSGSICHAAVTTDAGGSWQLPTQP